MNASTQAAPTSTNSGSPTATRDVESSGLATGLPGGASRSPVTNSNNGLAGRSSHSTTGLDSATSSGLQHNSTGTGLGHSNHVGTQGNSSSLSGTHQSHPSSTDFASAHPASSHHDHASLNGNGTSRSAGTNSHSSNVGNTSTHGNSTNVGGSSLDTSTTPHSSQTHSGPRQTATGPGFAHDATGAHAGPFDKVAGTAQTLAGKVTKDSRKVVEGQTRKSEGKEGVQAAKAEGNL